MPIEVRELVIRAKVEEPSQSSAAANAESGRVQNLNDREMQKIITLCAEEVLKILKRQKER